MFYEAMAKEISVDRDDLISIDELNDSLCRLNSELHTQTMEILNFSFTAKYLNETTDMSLLNESVLTTVVSRLHNLIKYAVDFLLKLLDKVTNVFRVREERISKFLSENKKSLIEKYSSSKELSYDGRRWDLRKLFNPRMEDLNKYIRKDFESVRDMLNKYDPSRLNISAMEAIIEKTSKDLGNINSKSDMEEELEKEFGKGSERKIKTFESYTSDGSYEKKEVSNFSAVSAPDMIDYLEKLPNIHKTISKHYEDDLKILQKFLEDIEKKANKNTSLNSREETKDGENEGKDFSTDVRDILSILSLKIQSYIQLSNEFKFVHTKVSNDATDEFLRVLTRLKKRK